MMKWVLTESDEEAAAQLSGQTGCHPLIARLLVNRGITDSTKAQSFLSSSFSDVSDPAIFIDMEKAVHRITSAITAGEKVVIYGDYDVDGVTGAALLYLVLLDLGAKVSSYIPDRMTEGYGLHTGALEEIRSSGAGLVITVDCGIGAMSEADHARSIGLDLIITDHHESEGLKEYTGKQGERIAGLPDAYALIHPTLVSPGVPAPVRDAVSVLTGVGVAFKLAQALMGTGAGEEQARPYLDLVTLGTIADMGQLSGENRIFVKHGLELLSSDAVAPRPGIAALKRVTGLAGREITAGNVGFTLAPRINASGRLERADMAFRLLTTNSQEEAAELAESLDAVNKERQAVELGIWEEARRMARHVDLAETGALVLASEAWHPGVVGIVASRIAEEFYRPTALIALQEGMGKGSARSIPGFDLYGTLSECADLLTSFGGHRYAAGFTVPAEGIPELRDRLSALVLERAGPEGFVRTLQVDGSVGLDELTVDLMNEIVRMAPFGQGNPEPRIGARGLEVLSSRIVGNNHLKLRLRQKSGRPFDSIAFSRGGRKGWQVREGSRMAAVFTPRFNTWNGKTSIELNIRDIKKEQ